jgi:hypothetical protein
MVRLHGRREGSRPPALNHSLCQTLNLTLARYTYSIQSIISLYMIHIDSRVSVHATFGILHPVKLKPSIGNDTRAKELLDVEAGIPNAMGEFGNEEIEVSMF